LQIAGINNTVTLTWHRRRSPNIDPKRTARKRGQGVPRTGEGEGGTEGRVREVKGAIQRPPASADHV